MPQIEKRLTFTFEANDFGNLIDKRLRCVAIRDLAVDGEQARSWNWVFQHHLNGWFCSEYNEWIAWTRLLSSLLLHCFLIGAVDFQRFQLKFNIIDIIKGG